MNLEELSFEKALKIYRELYSMGYLNTNIESKLACISLTCYITNALRKKGKNVNCYDVLLKIGNDFSEFIKQTFLKSLAVQCEDLMYGCEEFPTFGIDPKEAPKTLKALLNKYCPF